MIILDDMGHMVSTDSEQETHDFASEIGLKREWYDDIRRSIVNNEPIHPHYDLTTERMKKKAIKYGAQEVKARELLNMAWWSETS